MVTSAFLPLLRRATGRVVNIGGGGAGVLAMPFMGAGCASKFAVEAMTDTLRMELRRSGIRVSLVEPGMTYSEADGAAYRRDMNADLDAVLDAIPREQLEYYAAGIERMRAFYSSWVERARAPEQVARHIHHALTSSRPKSRYWCGLESKAGVLFSRIATARLRDAIWRRATGM